MKPNGPLEGYKKTCAVCGKEFWAMRDWKYKRRKDNKISYMCSWTCLNLSAREEGTEERKADT